MEEIQKALLFTMFNLSNMSQDATIDAINRNMELQKINNKIDNEIEALINQGYIVRKNNDVLLLTEKGEAESLKIREERIKDEFNGMISRAVSSQAYLDFCSEVSGYRMLLFNMMDKPQLDYLLNAVPINKEDTILDLGCGEGSILNYLVQKYQCQGIGIDQVNSEIVMKNNKLIKYINGSIDELEKYKLNPSITVAIDSMYFSNNLDKLLSTVTSTKDNRLYLYYSQYIFDENKEDRNILDYNNTSLAKSLEKAEVSYRVINYSENERNLYERTLEILPKYREALEIEGNGDIYIKKLNESRFGKELYDKNCASRYLYIVEQ
jgi:SAM-dependent methyltransferase